MVTYEMTKTLVRSVFYAIQFGCPIVRKYLFKKLHKSHVQRGTCATFYFYNVLLKFCFYFCLFILFFYFIYKIYTYGAPWRPEEVRVPRALHLKIINSCKYLRHLRTIATCKIGKFEMSFYLHLNFKCLFLSSSWKTFFSDFVIPGGTDLKTGFDKIVSLIMSSGDT